MYCASTVSTDMDSRYAVRNKNRAPDLVEVTPGGKVDIQRK